MKAGWRKYFLHCLMGIVILLSISILPLAQAMGETTAPISPWEYQAMLGRGMDVDWAKTTRGIRSYTSQTPQIFADAGIQHVRIRVREEADETLLAHLEMVVDDCVRAGLIPIIAYQADAFKKDPTPENQAKVVVWWKTVAERFRHVPHTLSFDVLIECTDALNHHPEQLNALYEAVVGAIRESNPARIIIISPRMRSDPGFLRELAIPSAHNGYLMAEWHFYAAGPSKTNEKKRWTSGTAQEKRLIQDKIDLALAWQAETGIPTWVGAWMPGDYNQGNHYSIDEQCAFAAYMTASLDEAGIPFAVNADSHFFDREQNAWFPEMQRVMQVIYQGRMQEAEDRIQQ